MRTGPPAEWATGPRSSADPVMPVKHQLFCAAVLAVAAAVAHATDVGVSVSVSQPGVYGRIDIGHTPPPVIYPQPVIIVQPVHAVPQPVYMRVPSGHAKNWAKHCHKYNACSTPVYFVKDEPHHPHKPKPHHHHDHRGPGKGHGHH